MPRNRKSPPPPPPAEADNPAHLSYGRKWLADKSRFKIGMWARQTGKSYFGTLEAVEDCRARPTTWLIVSAGERQALEAMLKAREHEQRLNQIAAAGTKYQEKRDAPEAKLRRAEMSWSHGSRLLAMPANANTIRGYSANLLLDEFAFHENPRELWRAIYPTISNPLKGEYRIRVLSTPNGRSNKFAELWHNTEKWSRHQVDIHAAVRAGLPVNVDELRAGLNDAEAWAQEYECQFLDGSSVLLSYDLIAQCESPEATVQIAPDFYSALRTPPSALYMGWDFARIRDLSVPWIAEQLGDVLHTREVVEMAAMSTPNQIANMEHRLQKALRVAVDYTGPGIGLGDELVKRFGEYNPDKHLYGKIDLVTFTAPVKQKLFSALRLAFEKHLVRVPVDRAIREDLHSMQRVTTPGGHSTYRAPHTDDGHADRCTALALCLRAAATAGPRGPAPGKILVFENTRQSQILTNRADRSVIG